MKSRTLVASLIVWFCFLLLLGVFLSPSPGRASGGSNLLQNPGFEEGKIGWSSRPQDATFTVTDTQVYSGSWAASLKKIAGTGLISIYQHVPVVGGGYYTLSGWVYYYKEDSLIEDWAMLRIDWRNSSGSLGTVDSQKLYGDELGYQERRIPYNGSDSVQAPLAATIARIECMAYVPDPETPLFCDDLSFTFQGSRVYLPLVVKNY